MEGVRPLTRVGSLLLAGQPTEEALEQLQEGGVQNVLDLRLANENRGFDERARCKSLDLTYTPLGFGGNLPPNDQVFSTARLTMAWYLEGEHGDLLVHCASANRVGAVWLAFRVMDEGVPWATALAEAKRIGLRSKPMTEAAQDYVLGAGRQALGKHKLKVRKQYPNILGINVDELSRQLTTSKKPLMLDVREPKEFAVSHLLGARRASNLQQAKDLLRGEPKDRDIVVYCSIGYRSAELASALQTAGYDHVRNLEGSIFEWANTGHRVFLGEREVSQVHPYDAEWAKLLDRTRRAKLE
jgi:rhodanese-related sulfurtransferase/protein tyrosine phosphatase (PTP) superfamily phosphohydrolase (DUF442 family)